MAPLFCYPTALGNSELPMHAVFFYIFFLSFTSKIQHKNVFLCIKVLDKSSKLCGASRQSLRDHFLFGGTFYVEILAFSC